MDCRDQHLWFGLSFFATGILWSVLSFFATGICVQSLSFTAFSAVGIRVRLFVFALLALVSWYQCISQFLVSCCARAVRQLHPWRLELECFPSRLPCGQPYTTVGWRPTAPPASPLPPLAYRVVWGKSVQTGKLDLHARFETRFYQTGSTSTSSLLFVDNFDQSQTSIQHNYPC